MRSFCKAAHNFSTKSTIAIDFVSTKRLHESMANYNVLNNQTQVLYFYFTPGAVIVAHLCLTVQVPETKIAEFANSVDLDEVAHNESPHLDLQCLPATL